MIDKYRVEVEKYKKHSRILTKWIIAFQQNRTIAEYVLRNKIETAAVYGMGEIGMVLYDELLNAGVKIPCVIDERADYMELDIESDMITPNDDIPNVDIIIVTAIYYFDDIKRNLMKKTEARVVSLEQVVMEL